MRIWSALLCCLLAGPAWAQGFIVRVPGGNDLPLALPPTQTPSGNSTVVSMEIYETVLRDLGMTGYFTLIDPDAYIEHDKGVEPGTFDFDDWSFLKASVLVKTRVLPAGDTSCDPAGEKSCADVFIYYVVSGDTLLKTRFRAYDQNARQMGHRIANAVVKAVTGTSGFFGSQIAAVGSQSGNKEIYVLDIDGRGVTPVTRNGSINLSPSWSPDGRQIAWTSYKKSNPDLYIKELGTGRTQVLSNKRGINASPAFHPNGHQLALARTSTGDSDIFVIDSDTGSEIEQLTHGGGIDVSPNFSRDGNFVAFASERSGGSHIYVKDLHNGETQRVTFHGDYNTDPVISPDGSELAFVGRSEGGFDIFVSDIDGRNLYRVTQDMGDNEDPAWSPDGMYLLFSSTRNGRSEIWLSTADGRHQVPITRSGGWTQPSWSPLSGD